MADSKNSYIVMYTLDRLMPIMAVRCNNPKTSEIATMEKCDNGYILADAWAHFGVKQLGPAMEYDFSADVLKTIADAVSSMGLREMENGLNVPWHWGLVML